MPKVSIIVPIYNVEKYLPRCMKSLLNQTLKDIEIILVDDESPDNSPVICDEYARQDSRIKVIHKKNEGLGFARNSGLEIATGEFVAFVDSDDFTDIKMYETLYQTAKESDLDTVYCSCYFYKDDRNITPKKEINELKLFLGRSEVDVFLLDMVGPEPSYHSDVKYMMSVWRAIYSRKLIDKTVCKFRSEREFVSEDILFHIDYLTKATRIGYTPFYFYFYCLNENSLTKTYTVDKIKKIKKLLTEIKKQLSANFNENEYTFHFKRLMFLYYRFMIQWSCKATNSDKRQLDTLINDNLFWAELFTDYPYWKLPIKHFLFYVLCKHKLLKYVSLFLKYYNDMHEVKYMYKRIRDKYYYSKRKSYLKDIAFFFNKKDISIISSNCFAGLIYQDLGHAYLSPTLGLYFMYPDFIDFMSNLRYYLKTPLQFVKESKYAIGNERIKNAKNYYPIALLDNKVEIHFLHYHSEKEAATKWERRCKRINFNNLVIIASEQNLCSERDIKNFDRLSFQKKVIFSSKDIKANSCLYIPKFASCGVVGDPYRQGYILYKYLIDYARKNNW
jgi:uncharacterized protein (DUF1919 family)/glycosyltransferase involved in cell wall biosynthesis